jgi:hypothetical protein
MQKNQCKPQTEIDQYLSETHIPKLTVSEKEHCEGLLTVEECLSVMKQFKTNKSPGNDGIPVEFYKKFWPLFGKLMVQSFNSSYERGELTSSQRQAVISLLDKDKDRRTEHY